MYNSTMQTITIINSHHITEGQYVALKVYTWTKPAVLANLILILYWGNKGGEGKGDVG